MPRGGRGGAVCDEMRSYDDEIVCHGCGQTYVPVIGETTDYTCRFCSDIDAINEYAWEMALKDIMAERAHA